MEQLTKKILENGQTFDISNKTWKLTLSVKKNLKDGDDDEQESMFEHCTMQVEILKVPGQDKYCVDFQRKAGSAILYYDNANKYIDLLELCNNTIL